MEPLGIRMRPEGFCLSDYSDVMELDEIIDVSEYSEDQETIMCNFSRNTTESSRFTYITDLCEDFTSQDTMATKRCFLATYSADTMYENSSLDLIIDRTCDFVASANSSRTLSDTADDLSSDDTQCVPECSVLTREVVGCEDPDFSGISQPEDTQLTVCPASRSSETSSTLSLCKNKESTKPLASSTMIDQYLQNNLSSDSILVPCASSTMTGEVNHSKPCKFQCTSDLHSIYTWSIYDKSQDTVFDESYVNGHCCVPDTPKTKVLTSSPQPSSCRMYKCETNKSMMPSELCRLPLMDCLSVIESSDCLRDGHVDVESLYDEDIPVKSNCLPRTSTKVNLRPVGNFHQVPSSSDDSGEDIVQERPEPDLPQPKSSKVFKFPKTTTQLKKLFSFRKSKGKNSDKTEPKNYTTETQGKLTDDKKSQDVVEVRNKKAVIKKMKSFSANVNKLDGSDLQVLALLWLTSTQQLTGRSYADSVIIPILGDLPVSSVGRSFAFQIIAQFGTNHIYNIDTFNEMKPKSNSTMYLARSAKVIYSTLTSADPQAVWLMQGWLFLSTAFWHPPQIKAVLTAVPKGRMIILDLFSEVFPVFSQTQSFYGQPFIWCMLHNFGGTMELYGRLDSINKGPFVGRAFPNSTMIGIGMTPEGIYQNEVIYEFFAENAWVSHPRNLTEWLSYYTRRRYGKTDKNVFTAWQYLKRSVYNNTDLLKDKSKHVVPTSRPQLKLLKPDVWYDPEDLYKAWDYFVAAADSFGNSLFLYDLVDVTRNSLQLLSLQYYHQIVTAYNSKDSQRLSSLGKNLINLLVDMDIVLGSDPHFLLGNWIEAARSLGMTEQEQALYEFNARNQITLWGPSGQHIDYASKQWSGLVSGYYRKRWELFIEMLINCLQTQTPFNQNEFNSLVYEKIEKPFGLERTKYPTVPTGNSVPLVKAIHTRYRPHMLQHFKFLSSGRPVWYGTVDILNKIHL